MILLYHGSNCEVGKPNPAKGRRGTDFAQGFYLTPDMQSARGMARNAYAREGVGRKTINVYEFDEDAARLSGLSIKRMPAMDMDWISFVIANRMGEYNAPDHNLDKLYDVVIGYIADDKIRSLIAAYSRGYTTAELILQKMIEQPWRVLQYSFHTQRAVKFLRLKEVWCEQ